MFYFFVSLVFNLFICFFNFVNYFRGDDNKIVSLWGCISDVFCPRGALFLIASRH